MQFKSNVRKLKCLFYYVIVYVDTIQVNSNIVYTPQSIHVQIANVWTCFEIEHHIFVINILFIKYFQIFSLWT